MAAMAWPCLWRGKSNHFWRFQTSGNFVLVWQAWHLMASQHVSHLSKDDLIFSWRNILETSIIILRGRRRALNLLCRACFLRIALSGLHQVVTTFKLIAWPACGIVTVYFTLYTLHSTLETLHFTLHTFTLDTSHSTIQALHPTHYIIRAQHSTVGTLHTLHGTPYHIMLSTLVQ